MQVCLPEMQKSFYHAVIRSCLVNWYQQATLVHPNDLGELGLITQCVTCTTQTISLKKKTRLHCCLRCIHTLQFVWVLTASSGLIDWKACSPFADVFLSIYHLLKLVQPQTLAGCCSPASTYQTLRNKCLWANKKPNIIFLKHKNEFAQFKIPIELRSVESRSQWADLSDISWWFYWLPSLHPEYQTANAVAVTYWATVFYSWV